MIPRALLIAFLAPVAAFAQMETNTVTVSASQTLNVQPDQVLLAVTVTSGIGSSLTDVLNALQPVGVTAAEFSGVTSVVQTVIGTGNSPPPQIQWTFILPSALTSMTATINALNTLQQSITQKNSGFTLSFLIEGTQISPQLQQMQVCPLAELLSNAQAQAQKLANVAGASLGAVLAIAGSTPNSTTANNVSFAVLGLYGFSTPQSSPVCSITVKFSLLH